jgi:hypothetical protein
MEFFVYCIPARMKPLLPLLSFILLIACRQSAQQQKTHSRSHTPAATTKQQPARTYEQLKTQIEKERKALYRSYQTGNKATVLQESRHRFVQILTNDLTPYWIGTPWDFNGTTQKPGEGLIACGYFVTTLLRDAGVRLNRVKLAQCASGQIIASQVSKKSRKYYGDMSFDDFINALKARGEAAYIIGLDFHTGFIVHDGTELYFIHSNYINNEGVVKEVAATSAALRASRYRLTGNLSGDDAFINRWLSQP